MKNLFCTKPFENVEIHPHGLVYLCCPNWNNYYSIGNLLEESFENIWNSSKAQELRKRILNHDYSLCDINGCAYCKQHAFPFPYREKKDCKVIMAEFPFIVKLSYDYECNIACKMCRDKKMKLPDEKLKLYNSQIDSFFIPMLKSAKILEINAHGDAFGSRHSLKLIEKAALTYPNLKFDFQTNGILASEKFLKNINITPGKIHTIRISMHAATAETYGKIVKNGENLFPVILENLRYLSRIRWEDKFFHLYIQFVVSADNYKEIPSFIQLAENLHIKPFFWELRSEQYSYGAPPHWLENDFICDPRHPLYEDLKRVLAHPLVKRYKGNFSPVLYDMIK